MITRINELKISTKNISCECECKFDGEKCNSDQSECACKKHHICEKDYIWNPATCSCKNGKYLASIIDDSVITSHEIIDADVQAKSNEEESKIISKI